MVVTIRLEHGAITIPDDLRAELGWSDGVEILAVAEDGELRLLRSDLPDPEHYTPRRKAEFLLNSAVTDADYAWAAEEVRRLGLDPETIPHERPTTWAR